MAAIRKKMAEKADKPRRESTQFRAGDKSTYVKRKHSLLDSSEGAEINAAILAKNAEGEDKKNKAAEEKATSKDAIKPGMLSRAKSKGSMLLRTKSSGGRLTRTTSSGSGLIRALSKRSFRESDGSEG